MHNRLGFLKMKLKKPLHSVIYEKKNTANGLLNNRTSRWKKQEQAVFIFRLGELLQTGYHLAEALRFLQSQESIKRRKEIDIALEQLKAGHTLFEVLSFLGFSPQLLQFVYYAEFYGDLPYALKEGGRFWSKRNADNNKILKIFIYPIILFVFVILISSVLQSVLLPKFISLYESMNIAPSVFLTFVVTFSQITNFIPSFLVCFLILFFTLKKYWFEKMRYFQRKKYIQRIPVVNTYVRMFDTYYLSYHLSGLLAGGLSINDSMLLLSKQKYHPFFQELGELMYKELNEGKSLESVFGELIFFEDYLKDVIANGQKNGKLDQELYQYSRIVLQSIESKVASVIKFVQPVLFVFVGSIVIAIYLSVLLPMFSVMNGL